MVSGGGKVASLLKGLSSTYEAALVSVPRPHKLDMVMNANLT